MVKQVEMIVCTVSVDSLFYLLTNYAG